MILLKSLLKNLPVTEITDRYGEMTDRKFSTIVEKITAQTFPDSDFKISSAQSFIASPTARYNAYITVSGVLTYTNNRTYKLNITLIHLKVPDKVLSGNDELDLKFLASIPAQSPELADVFHRKNSNILIFVKVTRIEHGERLLPRHDEKIGFWKDQFKGALFPNLVQAFVAIKKVINDDDDSDHEDSPDIGPVPTSPEKKLVSV